MQMEEDHESKLKEVKDTYNQERKKLVVEIEERLKVELEGREDSENELN